MRCGQANAMAMENMQHQQAEALANLATAMAADRQAVKLLSSSNATQTKELRAATATIATLQQHLAIFFVRYNTKNRGKRTAAATIKPTTPI